MDRDQIIIERFAEGHVKALDQLLYYLWKLSINNQLEPETIEDIHSSLCGQQHQTLAERYLQEDTNDDDV